MKVETKGGRYRVIAEINMVPLIDVALVLLIIFMIMTPLLVRSQLQINLPKAKAAERTPKDQRSIDVEVSKDGAYSVGRKIVTADALEAEIKSLMYDPEQQPLLIQADREAKVDHLVVVLDLARKLGLTKVGVGTTSAHDAPKPPAPPARRPAR